MLESIRRALSPLALTLLRVSTGLIMAVHGWQKLQDISGFAGLLTNMGIPAPQFSAYGAVAGEFLGGLGLLVGLFTPLAALGITLTLAVAVFKVHWANGLLASNNGYEYPLTLMLVAIYFMMHGAGPLSLDALFCKKKNPQTLSQI